MNKNGTVAITGAAGFIGSCLAARLNRAGVCRLILIDDFSNPEKVWNLRNTSFVHKVHRDQFEEWWQAHPNDVDLMYHLGARTDTTEYNSALLDRMNTEYSKHIWKGCVRRRIPLIYASSAATYGNGSLGYKDDESMIPYLKPLNPYGISKNEFDLWVLQQKRHPPFWAGLKFFNVYGPNEWHKHRMASVIWHTFQQIQKNGTMRLFKSHHPEYEDGGQLRDFIYVKDVVEILIWMMDQQPDHGIYNVGTGLARTFKDLALRVFHTLEQPAQIQYIDTPEDIRDNYQYFTEADMTKLRSAGYTAPFFSLEEGIDDYVKKHLLAGSYF